jgi:hypothetical protein
MPLEPLDRLDRGRSRLRANPATADALRSPTLEHRSEHRLFLMEERDPAWKDARRSTLRQQS